MRAGRAAGKGKEVGEWRGKDVLLKRETGDGEEREAGGGG